MTKPNQLVSDTEPEPEVDDQMAEEESAADQEPDAAEVPPGKSARIRRRPSGRTVAVAALLALLIASLATTAALAWNLANERAVADAGRQATAAAKQYAVALTSVDAANLDENFATVINGATGEFKDMYSQSSDQLKQLLIDSKAKSEGTVTAAGIKSATKNEVQVMLFVDQTVTNSVNPQPRLDRTRILITMEKGDGRWLASKVELP